MEDYWQPLFPTSVNVTDFKVFVYPNIDYNNAWKDSSESTNISPYVILKYKIKPSWEMRKKIKS
ncbi:MAG: hypothetical protein LBQ59_05645 [Candidatus Peribacteria bacterium]|jgi:hypothetical protein|nr:hypothetical protein [Candidatus Peribacteria bacterium]